MKTNILFVDDEQEFINSLKRQIKYVSEEWNPFFAENGKEALELLEKQPIDIILTDIYMPGMDGEQLLNTVKEKYPQTIRLILTGQPDNEKALQATRYAHQVIEKPFDYENLKLRIEKSLFLKNYLQNDNLTKQITGIGNLPSLPSLFIKLEKVLKTPDVSMQKVGEIISQDIAMTAKILQMVNSGFYSLPAKISNPYQAVQMLGINIIKSIVLYLNLFSTANTPKDIPFSLDDLWNHSYRVGIASRELLRKQVNDRQMLDDAFVAGILHDIGKLVLLKVKDYYKMVYDKMRDKGMNFLMAEYELFGTSHAEVGAYLLSVWGLPYSIIEAVAFHHIPSLINENEFSVLSSVHLANAFVHLTKNLDIQHVRSLKIKNSFYEILECCMKHEG